MLSSEIHMGDRKTGKIVVPKIAKNQQNWPGLGEVCDHLKAWIVRISCIFMNCFSGHRSFWLDTETTKSPDAMRFSRNHVYLAEFSLQNGKLFEP